MADDAAAASLRLARELQAQFDAEVQAEAAAEQPRSRTAAAAQPQPPIVIDSSIDEDDDSSSSSSSSSSSKRRRVDAAAAAEARQPLLSSSSSSAACPSSLPYDAIAFYRNRVRGLNNEFAISITDVVQVRGGKQRRSRGRGRQTHSGDAGSGSDTAGAAHALLLLSLPLCVCQGDIERAVLLNYCWDLPWLLSACPALLSVPRVECVAGVKRRAKASLQAQVERLQLPNIRCFLAALPLPFSCHHTKLMLLLYPTGLRLVLLTANFLACDLLYKNQAIFVQDFPLKCAQPAAACAPSSASSASSAPTAPAPSAGRCELGDDFERSLCEYFSAYVSCGLDLRAELRRFDYSAAYAVLIPSAPGLYKGRDMERWGHTKVRAVLEREEMPLEMQRQPVVAQVRLSSAQLRLSVAPSLSLSLFSACAPLPRLQFSSIGSVRPNVSQQQPGTALRHLHRRAAAAADDRRLLPSAASLSAAQWLTELCRSLGSHRGLSLSTSPPAVRLVWPTVRDVQHSLEGWIAGGSICCDARNHKEFMLPLYRRWDGSGTGRHRAAPHIKTYSRSRQQEAAFVLLTSANLSAAAWGELQKGGSQLAVRHYELGLLFTQQSLQRSRDAAQQQQQQQPAFSCTPHTPFHARALPVGSSSGVSQQAPPPLRRRAQLWLPLLSDSAGASASAYAASQPLYRVICPLPYSVTSAAYSGSDEPWAWDRDREERDCRGATFTRVGSGDDD